MFQAIKELFQEKKVIESADLGVVETQAMKFIWSDEGFDWIIQKPIRVTFFTNKFRVVFRKKTIEELSRDKERRKLEKQVQQFIKEDYVSSN